MDPSLVSKYRTGKRGKPTMDHQLHEICRAIASFYPQDMDASMLPANLRELLSEENVDADGFAHALFIWLSEGDAAAPNRKKTDLALKLFGEKFSTLQDIIGVSNIQLARALNVDSSLISLYRNGVRLPSARSARIDQISSYFAKQELGPRQKEALWNLLGDDGPYTDTCLLKERIFSFLSAMPVESAQASAAASFLETVDGAEGLNSEQPAYPLEEIAAVAIGGSDAEVAFGHRGMQEMAIKFLHYIASRDTPHTLHMYSDQSTHWLLENPAYTSLWASMMAHILKKGNPLRVIHVAEKDANGLFSALKHWMPLYMYGDITPYYFRSGENGRIRTSLFLAEDLALLSGVCTPGAEDKGVYRYDTDPSILASAKAQFDALMPLCGKLMQFYKGKQDLECFQICMNAFWAQNEDATALLPRLSLGTMPEALLQAILGRAQVTSQQSEQIFQTHRTEKKRIEHQLSAGRLEELCLLEEESVVCAGAVCLDLPGSLLETPIFYSPEEYRLHLSGICLLEEQQSNYRFYPLSEGPFRDIKLFFKEGKETIVQKLTGPMAAFSFDHVHLCSGISQFLAQIKAQSQMKISLEQYIQQ